MVHVVKIDDVDFDLHSIPHFGRACQGQECQQIHPTHTAWNLFLVIAIGSEGVITQNVMLCTYNADKF
jgi:hypothetical protein